MNTGPRLRYLAVSGACLLLHNGLLIGLNRTGLHYVAACLISFAVVAVAGFALHARFTFAIAADVAAFLRYAAAMALNLPLSLLLLWVLHDRGGMAMVAAAPASTALLIIWNYAASRWALLPKSMPDRGRNA